VSSIRRRLTLGLALACGCLWSAGSLASYLVMRAGLVAEFDRGLETDARALALLTSDNAGQVEFDASAELAPAFARAAPPDFFQLWLPGGSTLERSPSLKGADLPLQAGPPESPALWDTTLPDGRAGRAVGIRFVPRPDEDSEAPPASRPPRAVTLVVARNRTDLDAQLRLLATTLLLATGASVAAAAAVVAVGVRRGLSPLASLAGRAASIDATSLQSRFPTADAPAELVPICERLNELLARLEASFERERRFSADVAHELRTPIAELRSGLEVALKWPEDTNRTLQDALAIALQMEGITTSLLALARHEAGLQPVSGVSVGIAESLREAWRPLASQAGEKRLSVAFDVAEGLRCRADAPLLRLVLSNLLSNAVEYTPRGGSVRCRATLADGSWRLSVSNGTVDLGAEDLPYLFDRFWRKDPARSQTGRSGLGLALAKACATAMEMRLEAEVPAAATLEIALSGRVP
jgi:two-component system, OmpR family, heavy metal sensor histidine kinase CusS